MKVTIDLLLKGLTRDHDGINISNGAENTIFSRKVEGIRLLSDKSATDENFLYVGDLSSFDDTWTITAPTLLFVSEEIELHPKVNVVFVYGDISLARGFNTLLNHFSMYDE